MAVDPSEPLLPQTPTWLYPTTMFVGECRIRQNSRHILFAFEAIVSHRRCPGSRGPPADDQNAFLSLESGLQHRRLLHLGEQAPPPHPPPPHAGGGYVS